MAGHVFIVVTLFVPHYVDVDLEKAASEEKGNR
jgi:hypothetical protein